VPQRPTLHQWDGLALLCPTHGKAPETEGAVLSAEQLVADAPATLDEDLSPLAPLARPSGPANQPTAGNSNEGRSRGQDTKLLPSRHAQHQGPQDDHSRSHRRTAPPAGQSAGLGHGGQDGLIQTPSGLL
jgi:hypothetical protein